MTADSWQIYDSQITELSGFNIGWLPAASYEYVTPRVIQSRTGSEQVALEAGSFVGAIPLTNGATLYIVPRVGRAAFSRMLLVTEGLTDAIRDEFDDLAKLSDQSDANVSWVELLARPFINRLRLIEKSSIMPGRTQVADRLPYAKGKLAVTRTLLALERSEERPVHSNFRVKTYQTLENRTLGTATAFLFRLGLVPAEDQGTAARWMEIARNNAIRRDELRLVTTALQARKYTGSRSYYIPALLMARIILAQSGIGLAAEQPIEAEVLLTNLPILFEKYVRGIVAEEFVPKGYVVEKITSGARTLFLDGTCTLEPDILISKAAGVRLIADTKYKPGESIDTADYYQMSAYLNAFDVQRGLLILPTDNPRAVGAVRRDMPSEKHIFELRIPLQDWSGSEMLLKQTIEQLLKH